MVNIGEIGKKVLGAVVERSPQIATGVGIGGIFATGALFYRAGKMHDTVHGQLDRIDELEGKERVIETVKTVAPIFGPPVLLGVATGACFIFAQKLQWDKYNVLASAYAMTQTSFKEYQDKAIELLGKEKHEEIKESVLKDHAAETIPTPEKDYIIGTGYGDTLCMDDATGRWFRTSSGRIRKAEAEVVNRMNGGEAVSLNDFYEFLGLPPVKMGEQLGWMPDGPRPSVTLTSDVRDDDSVYYVLGYEYQILLRSWL